MEEENLTRRPTFIYSQYTATFEEYEQQGYEAASTLYGPRTLSEYTQEFSHLALAMTKGWGVLQPADWSPPPLSSKILVKPKGGSFKKGDRPRATSWSANPRNDLLTEDTFAVVEMLQGQQWIPVHDDDVEDDDDFCLYFKWKLDNSSFYTSFATIEGEVPKETSSGVHRQRHSGSSKKAQDSPIEYFTGASSAFTMS
ncbi:hypothetical protein H0E87_011446 [Populus deltoides]|uniref:ceramidase n=1 Tax=Populus deltoides TaxID=3696 RepID=A0A8T2YXE2_POPDE|nr:hypothetical protein H0E87_011446 [Populus deltoides]